jgi:predicted Co/Zn/Cd cation transporter (cation efflux family)
VEIKLDKIKEDKMDIYETVKAILTNPTVIIVLVVAFAVIFAIGAILRGATRFGRNHPIIATLLVITFLWLFFWPRRR